MRPGAREAAALVATVALHALAFAGLAVAARQLKHPKPQIKFNLKVVTPPPPRPIAEPPPPPPQPPPPQPPPPQPPPKPTRKVVAEKAAPPPAPTPPPPDKTPPPPQKIYVLPGEGSVTVSPQVTAPGGAPGGVPGGTGHAGGTAAPAETAGTGPKPAALSSLKSLPEPIGDYDQSRDYPDEARRLEIEGEVAVRVLVDDAGKVAEVKLVKGLGHGLDEKAVALARKLRFRPARDEGGRAVATWLPWTFAFTLPR